MESSLDFCFYRRQVKAVQQRALIALRGIAALTTNTSFEIIMRLIPNTYTYKEPLQDCKRLFSSKPIQTRPFNTTSAGQSEVARQCSWVFTKTLLQPILSRERTCASTQDRKLICTQILSLSTPLFLSFPRRRACFKARAFCLRRPGVIYYS